MPNSPTASLRVDYPAQANRDDQMDALGRNDWFKCIGLYLQPLKSQHRVLFQAINSRNDLGRCIIEVPYNSAVLREIAAKCQALADEVDRV